MQQKISTYETENARLQQELEETKVSSALKVSQRRADEAEARFEQRKLKRKQKHRGH